MPWHRNLSADTEIKAIFPIPRPLSLSGTNCRLHLETALNVGHTATLKVRKNGADSGIVWNFTDATTIGNKEATGSATFLENDRISIHEAGVGGTGHWGGIVLFGT